jgi:hypothetical protein
MLDASLEGIYRHDCEFRCFTKIFEQPTGRATFKNPHLKNPKVRRFLNHSGKDELPARNTATEPVLGEGRRRHFFDRMTGFTGR